MTRDDEIALAVELAFLNDLDRREKSAMTNLAHWVDKRRNRFVITNPNFDGFGLKEISVTALELCRKDDCKVCGKTRSLLSGTYDA